MAVQDGSAEPVASPSAVEQVQALVRWAAENDLGLRLGYSNLPAQRPCIRVTLERIASVRFFEPGDLTVGVDAGISAAALSGTVESQQEFLPLDVPAPQTTSVGAILAAHLSGPLRHRFGTVRDFTIGIEFVTAEGKLVRGGGRVVKNVAGYDLMKLMIGSCGTLGIITGANFRVFPKPQALATTAIGLPDWSRVEQLRSRLLHSFLHPLAFELVSDNPVPQPIGQSGLHVFVRYTGSASVLSRCKRELETVANSLALEPWYSENEGSLWVAINRFAYDDEPEGNWSRFRLGAPPAAGAQTLEAVVSLLGDYDVRFQGRLGLGAFILQTKPAIDSAVLAGLDDVASRHDGFIEAIGGNIENLSPRSSRNGNTLEVMRELKQQFDPRGIFEPAIRLA